MQHFDCIVVGGGASGLVFASRMARSGRSILLLEAEERLGGCVHSWRPAGDFWLELGAHTAYNSYGPLLEALADRDRLGELVVREPVGYRFFTRDGKTQSPMARLNFLEALLHLPFGLFRAKEGKSVAEWFSGLLGNGNYRRLLSPAFAAVLSQNADLFPASWLFRKKPRMKSAPRKFTFAGGLQGLLEAVAEGAAFQTLAGHRVESLARDAAGWRVTSGKGEFTCRQLCLATPVDVTAALLTTAAPEIAQRLARIPVMTSEALALVVPASRVKLPPLAGLIGDDDAFTSVVTRDPVPHEQWRGYTFHFKPGLLDRAGKEQRAAAVLGVTPADFLHVAEALNRLPAPRVEHVRLAEEVLQGLAGQPLALVGNYLIGLSIGDCAELAARESDRLSHMKG